MSTLLPSINSLFLFVKAYPKPHQTSAGHSNHIMDQFGLTDWFPGLGLALALRTILSSVQVAAIILPSCPTVFLAWPSFSSSMTLRHSLETASLVAIPVTAISSGSLFQVGRKCVYKREKVVKKGSLGHSVDLAMENLETSNN